jgi:hypothetical protein
MRVVYSSFVGPTSLRPESRLFLALFVPWMCLFVRHSDVRADIAGFPSIRHVPTSTLRLYFLDTGSTLTCGDVKVPRAEANSGWEPAENRV